MSTPGDAEIAARGGPHLIERQVREALIAQLFASTPQAVAGGMLFSVVIAWVVSHHASLAVVLAWLALRLVLGAVRIAHVRRFLALTPLQRDLDRWVPQYVAMISLDTAVWSSMILLFAPGAPTLSLALLMCGVVGVASVGVLTTFSHWPTALVFNLICLVPMALWFAVEGGEAGWAVTVGCLIYGVMLGFESWRQHGTQAETIRLRLENAELARERADALAAAESSNEAKGRFLAMVSHEIRTPLNGIFGMVQVMRGAHPDPKTDHALQVVEGSARHLGRIIGDLLDLSRMDFARLELHPAPMNVREVIGDVVELLQPLGSGRGLTLSLSIDGEVPERVRGDAARIGQVLHNLVGNALKFTERGGVTVSVRCPAAGQLAIEVADTGPGIAPADLERVFEAFERVGDVGLMPGTGLGLTIARRLARAMGGDVTCESHAGQGSTFRFTLEAPQEAASTEPSAPGSATAPGLAAALGAAVLVVDDNEVNALVARSMLAQMGVACDTAANGEEALQAMRSRRYAAVLMDCHMPVLDGWEATRRWRAGESGQRLPVIGVTASAAPEDRLACLEAGMDEHLPKPFEKATLAELLRRVSSRTQEAA